MKTLHSLKISFLIALFFSITACVDQTQTNNYKIAFNLPANWSLVDSSKEGRIYIKTYKPQVQSNTAYEYFYVTHMTDRKLSLSEYLNMMAEGWKRSNLKMECLGGKLNVKTRTNNFALYTLTVSNCRKNSHAKLISINKAFKTPNGIYEVAYQSTSKQNILQSHLNQMSAIVESATIEKNN